MHLLFNDTDAGPFFLSPGPHATFQGNVNTGASMSGAHKARAVKTVFAGVR